MWFYMPQFQMYSFLTGNYSYYKYIYVYIYTMGTHNPHF